MASHQLQLQLQAQPQPQLQLQLQGLLVRAVEINLALHAPGLGGGVVVETALPSARQHAITPTRSSSSSTRTTTRLIPALLPQRPL